MVTSKAHQGEPIADWASEAACKGLRYFLEWPLSEADKVCGVCDVRADCHTAGLMPRQIQAMP